MEKVGHNAFACFTLWKWLLGEIRRKQINKRIPVTLATLLCNSKSTSIAHFTSWIEEILTARIRIANSRLADKAIVARIEEIRTELAKKDNSNLSKPEEVFDTNTTASQRWIALYHIVKPFLIMLNINWMKKTDKDGLKERLVDKLFATFEKLQSEIGQGEIGSNSQLDHGHQSEVGKELNSDEGTWQPNEPQNKERTLVPEKGDKGLKARPYRISRANTQMAKADMLKASLQEFWQPIIEALPGKDKGPILEEYGKMVRSYDHLLTTCLESTALQQAKKWKRTDTWVNSLQSPPKSPNPSQTDAGGSALNSRCKTKSIQTDANVKCDVAKLQKAAKIPRDLPKRKPGGSKLTDDEKEHFKKYADKSIKNRIKCTKPMIIEALNLSKGVYSNTNKSDKRPVRTLYDRWRVNDLGLGFLALYDIGWPVEELEVYSKLILAKHGLTCGNLKKRGLEHGFEDLLISKIEKRDASEVQNELFFAEIMCDVKDGERQSDEEIDKEAMVEALQPLLSRTIQMCQALAWSARHGTAHQV